jgi:ornithine carbamoyltransferase
MADRTRLLKQNDRAGLKELENRCLARNREFVDWECTEASMRSTRDGKALYLHCLPADISGVSCERGEVAATVFERYRRPLYLQAGYKPYIIAAMMFLSKFEDPAEKLDDMISRNEKRVL